VPEAVRILPEEAARTAAVPVAGAAERTAAAAGEARTAAAPAVAAAGRIAAVPAAALLP